MKTTFLAFSTIVTCAALFTAPFSGFAQKTEKEPEATANPAPEAALQAPQDSLPPIDSMPVLLEFIKADYPSALVKKGIAGEVMLDLVVDTLGAVDSVAVVKGLHPALDSSAAAAAKKFRFKPAMAGGTRVPVLMEYAYRFTIDEVVEKIERYVNLKGVLKQRGTRSPVRFATVVVEFTDTTADTALKVPYSVYLKKIGGFDGQHLEEGRIITESDSLGQFSFSSLPNGPVYVKVISPGYEQLVEREYIHPGQALEVTYYVQNFSYGENEIVVYGKAEEKEVAKRTLTLNEVKKIPGFGGDAVKVVQALPGVARASFMSGAIVVRGANNEDSKFYLDGIEIPVLFHFGGIKSTYNSSALQSVDFYPGGFGTRYGNVTAGVIELTGRPAKTDRVHAALDVSMYDGSLIVEGPVTKGLSLIMTGRRSFIGDILSWAAKQYELPFTIQPYYWDYTCRVDYTALKNHKFHLTLFGSQDYMKLIMSSSRGLGTEDISSEINQVNTTTTFNMGIANWTWAISPSVKNDLTYAFTYLEDKTSVFGFMKVQQQIYYHQIKDQASITLSPTLTVNAGVDLQLYPVDINLTMLSFSDTVVPFKWKNWYFGDVAPYLNLDWKPIDKLEIIPGIRYDYFPELKNRGSIVPAYWNYSLINNRRGAPGEPSARLTMRYKLTNAHTIKASVGNYSQTPQPIGQAITEELGDPYLPSTKAAHYVAGYEWKITDLISADVQGYYNQQWDIPRARSPADINPDSKEENPKGYFADEKGRMYGLELMLKHDQGKHFFGWIAYSLSRSERWDPHTNKYSLYPMDQTHNIQLIGNFRLPSFWEVGFRMRYVTGNPTTPIAGISYNEDLATFVRKNGEINSARMDPFVQLDLRIDKKFTFKNWMFSVYLDIYDLSYLVYKSTEFDMYNYRYDPASKTPIDGIIYPSLGLTAEF
jgi:TonB family protein